MTAAERAMCISQWNAEREAIHADIVEILDALGLGDHARPYSTHEVVQREILPRIRTAVDVVGYDARRLLAYAMHLRQHGERAPGGDETWAEFDRRVEALLRRSAP